MRAERATTWLLFDGDCRVCAAAAAWVHALDLRRRIRVQAIQESAILLRDVPEAERLGAVHAVRADGRVATGPEALPVIVGALSGGPAIEGLLRSSPSTMGALSRMYSMLVEIRARLTCGLGEASSVARTPR